MSDSVRIELHAGDLTRAVDLALAQLVEQRAVERLWSRDASLWSDEPAAQAQIAGSLGWLDSPQWTTARLPELEAYAAALRTAGTRDVVLMGMGGSSLAAEVIHQVFGALPEMPAFHMLDSTIPGALSALESGLELERTAFILGSKSGGTLEVECFKRHFLARLEAAELDPARRIAVITDPGSALAAEAAARGWTLFLNDPEVGGRYSALTLFGLVPAAAMGIPAEELLAPAREVQALCRRPGADNPALRLGAFLGALGRSGADQMTLWLPGAWDSLSLWIEQLVAESTGKQGRGIAPIAHEPLAAPERYGPDRLFVRHRFTGDQTPEAADAEAFLRAVRRPWAEIMLPGPASLGGAFFLWSAATAFAAALLRVNPFDQPDVQSAKDQTGELLAQFGGHSRLSPMIAPEGALMLTSGDLVARLRAANAGSAEDPIDRWLGGLRGMRHLAITAYLPPHPQTDALIARLRAEWLDRSRAATSFGYGPRYLHSTGQLHKGGPAGMAMVQLVTADESDLPVPGRDFSFGVLQAAQSLGDLKALAARGRPLVRIVLEGEPRAALRELADALAGR